VGGAHSSHSRILSAALLALDGVPAAWTGLGALLAGAGERAPAHALTLASSTDGLDTRRRVDLSGIRALPDRYPPGDTGNVRPPSDSGRGGATSVGVASR